MYGPYRYPPRRRIYSRPPYLRQVLTVLAVIVAALVFVVVIDKFSHPGKTWSDTLLVRMMVERRLSLPFFRR
ncbi:MAG: hypothetical protein PHF19_06135 [Synergistales bacterium]|jgi:hypothetical protein|nr:hypothetical protein [Synergistales bacterium]